MLSLQPRDVFDGFVTVQPCDTKELEGLVERLASKASAAHLNWHALCLTSLLLGFIFAHFPVVDLLHPVFPGNILLLQGHLP